MPARPISLAITWSRGKPARRMQTQERGAAATVILQPALVAASLPPAPAPEVTMRWAVAQLKRTRAARQRLVAARVSQCLAEREEARPPSYCSRARRRLARGWRAPVGPK